MWAQSYSGNSNSSFELDFLGEGASALMVNPSSVMPFVSSQRRFENKDKLNDSEEAKQSESLEPNEQIDVSFHYFINICFSFTKIQIKQGKLLGGNLYECVLHSKLILFLQIKFILRINVFSSAYRYQYLNLSLN